MATAHSQAKPLRILFLIDNLRPAGAQKALLAIVSALRLTRAEPIVWRLGGTSPFEERFRELGVPVLGGGGVWQTAAQPLSLLRYLVRERVSLVQTMLFHSDVTGRLIGRLARLFSGSTGTPLIVSSVRASNVQSRWWQFLMQRMTAPLAHAFTAVSQRTLDFAVRREGVIPGRAEVIPNGIDMTRWAAAAGCETARAGIGLQREAFVVGTVGRLSEQKGHSILLAAARSVLAELPEAVFLIVGYGPLRRRLERRAEKLGIGPKVRFLEYRSDIPRLLAAMDVFVLPSLWEGMSNAILEAMAAGKPVVATAVDGNVEQVVHGETGFLVPAGDAEALADALLQLAHDRRTAQAMGEAGRAHVAREFTLGRTTGAYLNLYERLLEEKIGIKPETWRQACPTSGA